MKNNNVIFILSLTVVLLAGIAIGQYLHIKETDSSVVSVTTESTPVLPGDPASARDTRAVEPGKNRSAVIEETVIENPVALTNTQYWISTDIADNKAYGFSAWIELVKGGNIMLEKCNAPDYKNLEVDSEQDPYLTPECTMIISSQIRELANKEILLSDQQSIGFTLNKKDEQEQLILNVQGQGIVIHPGQKNTLWEGLGNLPSVQQAYKQKWEEHVSKRMKSMEKGN